MSELWSLWKNLVVKQAGKPILHVPGSGWTSVAGLDSFADRIASNWAEAGLRGKIVLFSAPNGPEWLAGFLALQKLDAIVASADPSTPEELLKALAGDIGAGFIANGCKLACNGNDAGKTIHGPVLAKITSGSTGKPGVIPFSAEEMLADGRAVMQDMGIGPDDISYALVPFGHSYGLGNLVMPLILSGCACACSSSSLPRLAAQDMEAAGVTVCPGVPAFFRAMAETDMGSAPTQLRLAVSAGSALTPQVAAAFEQRFGMRIHNFLGSSETGGIAYDREGSAGLSGAFVGSLMSEVSASTDRDERLLVSGPAVGKYGNPLRRNGHAAFLLGDRGTLDEHGNLTLLGRAAPLAKIGGRRVDPLEVERTIRSLEGVTDACVLVAQAAGSDRLFALVESCRSEQYLGAELRKILPGWKLPRKLVRMDQFPRNDRGKLMRSDAEELLGISHY